MNGNWEGSTRRDRLPANWQALRRQVHRRDKSQCQMRLPSGSLCLEPATDVDHIRRGDNHDLSNLRCICDWHHSRKSAEEGRKAYWSKINHSKQKFRRDERHPGLR